MNTNPVLNDDEKVELIKKYWRQYGTWFIGLLIAIFIALLGWQAWQRHEARLADQAGLAFQSLIQAVSQQDQTEVQAQVGQLLQKYPQTVYASAAALLSAKQSVEQKEWAEAEQHLQWVIQQGQQPMFVELATLRLARILLMQKKLDQALTLLASPSVYFPGTYWIERAQILTALNKPNEAQQAYQAAVAALPKEAAMQSLLTLYQVS